MHWSRPWTRKPLHAVGAFRLVGNTTVPKADKWINGRKSSKQDCVLTRNMNHAFKIIARLQHLKHILILHPIDIHIAKYLVYFLLVTRGDN